MNLMESVAICLHGLTSGTWFTRGFADSLRRMTHLECNPSSHGSSGASSLSSRTWNTGGRVAYGAGLEGPYADRRSQGLLESGRRRELADHIPVDCDYMEIFDLNFEDYHCETDMKPVPGIRMKRPVHPAEFAKHEIIEALDLTATRAAETLAVTRAALSAVLNKRARLPPGDGLACRKGIRRVDGHLHADAEQLRHCNDARARERDQGCRIQEKGTRQQTWCGLTNRKLNFSSSLTSSIQ